MLNFVIEQQSLWQRLKKAEKPIILYGMGDGAQKVIDVLNAENIKIADIFASDEFVRGHSFNGIRVKRFSEICSMYNDFFILVCFAVDYEPMLSRLFELDEKYEVAAPDVPLFGSGVFDIDFLNRNEEKINRAYSALSDDFSKKVFENIINYKISGKLCYLRGITTLREDDLKELFEFSETERYLDLGAYDGDTVREFERVTDGKFKSITALEPDSKNFSKLCAGTAGDLRIKPVCKAVWSENTTLRFGNRAGRNSALKPDGKALAETVTVDTLAGECGFDFIKMDVEGAEKQALLGARRTIEKFKPKLFVSAYHRNEDIFELILLIKEINDGYEIYLRKHPYIPAWEVNILAKLQDSLP